MRTHQVSAEIARRKATFVCSLLQRPFMTAERGQQASCPLVSCSCSCRAYAPARAPGPARSDLRSASTLSTLQRVALYSSRFAFSFGVRRSAFGVRCSAFAPKRGDGQNPCRRRKSARYPFNTRVSLHSVLSFGVSFPFFSFVTLLTLLTFRRISATHGA